MAGTAGAGILGFPNPVNEKAARVVAAGVLGLSSATLAASARDDRWLWLTAPLAAGFLARVAAGPTLSPLGQLATRVVAPRLGAPRPVPGPPKRFAQGIGLAVSGGALAATAAERPRVARGLLGVLVAAAGLEAAAGFCLGCWLFARLIEAGLVPEGVCEACANVTLPPPRPPDAAPGDRESAAGRLA
jgi:Domain of unknown function (DUF4395)